MSTVDTRILDGSGDHSHFTILPNVLWSLVQSPYEFMLYATYKRVAGESGICWMSASKLAKTATMSVRQVFKSRDRLVELGLIQIEREGNPGAERANVTLVNVWSANARWVDGEPMHQVQGTPAYGAYPYAPGAGVVKKNTEEDPKKKTPQPPAGQLLPGMDEEPARKNGERATPPPQAPAPVAATVAVTQAEEDEEARETEEAARQATEAVARAREARQAREAGETRKAEEVWAHFVKRFNWRGNSAPLDKIKARLKHYTAAQLNKAIDNVADDGWYMENQRHNAKDFLFRSDGGVEKYMAMVPRPADRHGRYEQPARERVFFDIDEAVGDLDIDWGGTEDGL